MVSFIVGNPLSLSSHRKRAFRLAASPRYNQGVNEFAVAQISSRLRNKGGFRLPPQVPVSRDAYRRAIELLGAYTQRKQLHSKTIAELESLVGGTPSNRLVAQRWKGALELHRKRNESVATEPTAFRNRKYLTQHITLPESRHKVALCFSLLGVVQECYRAERTVSPKIIEKLTENLGSYPTNYRQCHHYIKALAYLNTKRKAQLRKPPRIPTDNEERAQLAIMLLGTLATKKPIGAQASRLESIIGMIPPDENVALHWKKAVAAAMRTKRRKERVARNKAIADAKRQSRRLKKIRRLQQLERAAAGASTRQATRDASVKSSAIQPSSEILESHRHANENDSSSLTRRTNLLRLYAILGRVFSWKRS